MKLMTREALQKEYLDTLIAINVLKAHLEKVKDCLQDLQEQSEGPLSFLELMACAERDLLRVIQKDEEHLSDLAQAIKKHEA